MCCILCNRRGSRAAPKIKQKTGYRQKNIRDEKKPGINLYIKKENAVWRKEIKRNVYMRLMQQGSRNTHISDKTVFIISSFFPFSPMRIEETLAVIRFPSSVHLQSSTGTLVLLV